MLGDNRTVESQFLKHDQGLTIELRSIEGKLDFDFSVHTAGCKGRAACYGSSIRIQHRSASLLIHQRTGHGIFMSLTQT